MSRQLVGLSILVVVFGAHAAVAFPDQAAMRVPDSFGLRRQFGLLVRNRPAAASAWRKAMSTEETHRHRFVKGGLALGLTAMIAYAAARNGLDLSTAKEVLTTPAALKAAVPVALAGAGGFGLGFRLPERTSRRARLAAAGLGSLTLAAILSPELLHAGADVAARINMGFHAAATAVAGYLSGSLWRAMREGTHVARMKALYDHFRESSTNPRPGESVEDSVKRTYPDAPKLQEAATILRNTPQLTRSP